MDEKLKIAQEIVARSPLCVRTPLLADCYSMFQSCFNEAVKDSQPSKLGIKLEHMQRFGSFKIRGIVNQFHHLPEKVLKGDVKLVTMSAGNYGRSFTEACVRNGLKGIVVLPEFAPSSRVEFIMSKGMVAEKVASCDVISRVHSYEEQGHMFLHSFDDPNLIYGYGSISKEIYADEPLVDVIVVCCGGGGLLAGVSVDAKLRNPNCRVYGVEPINANSMYRSFEVGKAVSLPPNSKSIASGLSAPYAGEKAYAICKENVEEIILVSEEEIKQAVKSLYDHGLAVEPAGSAAFAAFMFNKIPDVANKNVVVILTGRNMTITELGML